MRVPAAMIMLAVLLDAGAVVGFAALGRRSHDEAGGVGAVPEVAAPFLIALALGWLASRAWNAPLAARTGLVVWVAVVAGGLALRGLAFDRGVPVSFAIVTAATIAAALMGWRALARRGTVRRSAVPGAR